MSQPIFALSFAIMARGFKPADASKARLGLSIMQERADAVGISLTINSKSGEGTVVEAVWPGRRV